MKTIIKYKICHIKLAIMIILMLSCSLLLLKNHYSAVNRVSYSGGIMIRVYSVDHRISGVNYCYDMPLSTLIDSNGISHWIMIIDR